MVEEKYTSDLVLEGDALDRGEYALTLFKIIAAYSPKKPPKGYELIDTIDLGPINRGEIKLPDITEDEARVIQERINDQHEPELSTENQTTSSDVVYTSKLHHLDNDAFIMGISGAWGTGKTTFVEMFEKLLLNQGIVYISDKAKETINKDTTYKKDEVIFFNSWQNDFYENPMIPFSKLLIEKICGKGSQDYNDASKEFSSYLNILRNTSTEIYQKNDNDQEDDNIIPLEKRISNLKSILHKCIRNKNKEGQRKAVVIVDELDRCKPTFAIQLLEVVKHLFNVKGLVFIFSLDIGELQHCVKTVYGQGFDAIGYLERFFDYTSVLPKGNDRKLMEKYVKEFELADSVEYYTLCKQFSLTPREMKGICSSFFYLNKYSLEGYPDKARLLYFYILLLKYKYPEDVQILNDQNDDASEARKRLFGNKRKQPKFLSAKENFKPFFNAVIENKTLAETIFYYVKTDDSTEDDERHIGTSEPIKMDDTGSWSYILYAKDFERGIPAPSDTYVLEFLFNKVESYSKDIPMIKKEEEIARGSIITFGKWHKVTEEDMEPIEWIVLDVEDGEALLISRYGIDCQPYNTEKMSITWKECSLRKWLNNDFLTNAFSKEEQGMMAVSHVMAKRNPRFPDIDPGKDTDDKVFLLSVEEAARYFPNNEVRHCKPTVYALKKKKAFVINDGNCVWWLRSPGEESKYAVYVNSRGLLRLKGDQVITSRDSIRPCLKVHL